MTSSRRGTIGGTSAPNLSPTNAAIGFLVLACLAIVLVVLDLGQAFAGLFQYQHFELLGPSALGPFVVQLLRHPTSIASYAASNRREVLIPAALFWPCVATCLGMIAGVIFASGRVVRRLGFATGGIEDGFAAPALVARSAGLEAARRRSAQTRPSLVDTVLAAREIGYPLGTTLIGERGSRGKRGQGIDLWASWETSLQLVAPPGAGKTLRVLAPIVRQHPGPVLATSTKSDLYELCAMGRTRRGPVFALDPERLVPGAKPLRWSPVLGCESTEVAERRAAALIAANGESSDLRSGAFFRRSATAVLAAYLHAAALSGATIADVCRWAARPSDSAPLRILVEVGNANLDWSARLHQHTTGAEETTSGVMRSVDLALGCFRHAQVLELCSVGAEEAFDFDAFFDKGASVFALGKDRGSGASGAAPLVTAFCEELLLVAENRAATSSSCRLDPPLLACLDEAPSIAPLPGLPALLADGRGRGITVVYAMQSFSQAVARWGKSAAATMRNATTITAVFGGLGVAEDLDELSRLCGTRKVLRHSTSADANGARTSIGTVSVDEPVLSPAEIRALEEGVLLVLWGNLPPMLAHVPGIWEHPDAEQIKNEALAIREEDVATRPLVTSS